jgi:hypothetical protein
MLKKLTLEVNSTNGYNDVIMLRIGQVWCRNPKSNSTDFLMHGSLSGTANTCDA